MCRVRRAGRYRPRVHIEREASEVTLSGRLEPVDVRSAGFRILDAVGNVIDLVEFGDAGAIARLIGEVVTVTGAAVRGPDGRLLGVAATSVAMAALPTWPTPTLPTFDNAKSPPMTGIDGVDDDEVAAFLALLRR